MPGILHRLEFIQFKYLTLKNLHKHAYSVLLQDTLKIFVLGL